MGDDEDQPLATINTTPLVDVMLVLLIIFLITIPVVTHSVPVALPKETAQIAAGEAGAKTIAIDRAGILYWDDEAMVGDAPLAERLTALATDNPHAVVRVRGDQEARYEAVAKVLRLCGEAGIAKVSFVTEPPARGEGR